MDLTKLTDAEVADLRADLEAERMRRQERAQLPEQLAWLAQKWGEHYPDDPDGWREIENSTEDPQ